MQVLNARVRGCLRVLEVPTPGDGGNKCLASRVRRTEENSVTQVTEVAQYGFITVDTGLLNQSEVPGYLEKKATLSVEGVKVDTDDPELSRPRQRAKGGGQRGRVGAGWGLSVARRSNRS